MLHITNGDIAAELIRNAGMKGTVLPWRDVLHEGPLPGGLSLAEMSEIRARFLVETGWAASFDEVRREFSARDAALMAGLLEDEIVLWFEADLYDQLQLIQILDWLALRQHPLISMICIGEFPGFPGFQGLGQLTSSQLGSLYPGRRPVNAPQLDLAQRAWSAITAPSPQALNLLAREDTTALQFLGAELFRLLEHYPFVTNGLDRTESQLLRVIWEGSRTFEAIFPAFQALEERPFVGDATLWNRLLALRLGPDPLIHLVGTSGRSADLRQRQESRVELTPFGERCLREEADHIAANGIDRWVGGVHLTPRSHWRWDPPARSVGEYPIQSAGT